ncbi:MAG: DUF1152 domain-containing protein [Acidilobaceae archaeon]
MASTLVVAIGGGGDVVSAAMLARAMRRCCVRAVVASIAWERFHVDPVPGPVRLDEIRDYLERGRGYVLVSGSSYAERGGSRVVFAAARVARALEEPVYVLDIWSGAVGLAEALLEVSEKVGASRVVGVDVGGDSLALGFEETLWSPLADLVGLAALARVGGVLAVHSPGSDGELSQSYVLSRVDELSRRGALLGGRFMEPDDAELLEKLVEVVETEASRIPLLAFRGLRGELSARRGSRVVEVSLFSTATFLLDARKVAESNPLVAELSETRSLDEARRVLNEHGIYTELDLEEDLARLNMSPRELTGEILLEVRRRGRERLARSSTRRRGLS